MPPEKKTDAKTYEWHDVHQAFQSPTELRGKLLETFQDKLPNTLDFQVGYLTRRGNSKRWIEQEADLISMYSQFEQGDTITIFCDGKSMAKVDQTPSRKRKRASDDIAPDHEEEVKRVADELNDMHGEQWNRRQYLLWARMFVNKQWTSLDEEPDIPLFRGGIKTPRKKETLTDAILTFAKAITSQPQSTPSTQARNSPSVPVSTGVSPASKAKLSSTYITQLRELQQLRESGVLSEDEFLEQKKFALDSIRKMNK